MHGAVCSSGQTWYLLLCLHLDGLRHQRRSRILANVAEVEVMDKHSCPYCHALNDGKKCWQCGRNGIKFKPIDRSDTRVKDYFNIPVIEKKTVKMKLPYATIYGAVHG